MTHDPHASEPAEPAAPDTGAADSEADTPPRAPEPAKAAREAPRPPAHAAAAGAAKLQPGWLLSASGEQLTREEILARYRRQRGLPDDPFANGARPVPPPGYRDRIMNEPRSASFVRRPAQADAAPPQPPRQPRTFTLGQTMAISAAVALVAGAGAGVMGARNPDLLNGHSALVAGAAAVAPPSAAMPPAAPAEQLRLAEAPARDTVIDKKPVSTATLQVEDVTGETNSFIPLALHAEPAGLEKDMLLKISGVPEDAYLTSGRRQEDNVWALSLAETRNVKLVVPQTDDPQIDLAVAAFEPGTGELAAPVKTMTVALKDVVVQAASAPPPGVTAPADRKAALPGAGAAGPVPIPPPDSVKLTLAVPETAETIELISAANALLDRGDVSGARKDFARAWGNDGSAAAAFGMARSHDPLVLAALPGSNVLPDTGEALRWYQRAAAGGNPEAAEAIIRLQMKP